MAIRGGNNNFFGVFMVWIGGNILEVLNSGISAPSIHKRSFLLLLLLKGRGKARAGLN